MQCIMNCCMDKNTCITSQPRCASKSFLWIFFTRLSARQIRNSSSLWLIFDLFPANGFFCSFIPFPVGAKTSSLGGDQKLNGQQKGKKWKFKPFSDNFKSYFRTSWTLEQLNKWTLEPYTWTFDHLNIWILENWNTWTFEQLDTWTFEQLNIWTFEHLNTWTFEHLYTWTLEHLNLWSF